jgi:uncharacterized membrane protein
MLPKNIVSPGPSWKLRRRAVFGSLIFGMGIIIYVALRWDSTSLAETLALGSFGLIGAVVAAYIGGAVYEDVRLPQYQKRLFPQDGKYEENYEEEEG